MKVFFAGGEEFVKNRKWDFPFVRTVDDLRFLVGSGSLASAEEVASWMNTSPRAAEMPTKLRNEVDKWIGSSKKK